MKSPGEVKQLLEKRVEAVKTDLDQNSNKYDKSNIALREYEIMQLNQRISKFN